MENWKEQFDKRYGGLFGVKGSIKNFIQTEVIEKLIEDIPDEHSAGMFLASNKDIKEQLRKKWLQ
jgi:hypothetical protein